MKNERVRVQTSIGVELDLPDGWELDDNDRPICLRPRGVDTPVQISVIAHAARGPGAPNEKSVLLVLGSIAQRLAGERYMTPGGERSGGASLVRAEASAANGSAVGWMDFWAHGSDPERPDARMFGAGVRQWPDRVLVLTWIGPARLIDRCAEARQIFDSADLIT